MVVLYTLSGLLTCTLRFWYLWWHSLTYLSTNITEIPYMESGKYSYLKVLFWASVPLLVLTMLSTCCFLMRFEQQKENESYMLLMYFCMFDFSLERQVLQGSNCQAIGFAKWTHSKHALIEPTALAALGNQDFWNGWICKVHNLWQGITNMHDWCGWIEWFILFLLYVKLCRMLWWFSQWMEELTFCA